MFDIGQFDERKKKKKSKIDTGDTGVKIIIKNKIVYLFKSRNVYPINRQNCNQRSHSLNYLECLRNPKEKKSRGGVWCVTNTFFSLKSTLLL